MSMRKEATPSIGLLMALGMADGPINDEERNILLTFLAVLRTKLATEADKNEDSAIIAELNQGVTTAKSIQDYAAHLYSGNSARLIFARFFAMMAVADGVPNEKERIMIGRIQAALRSASQQ